MKKRIFTILFLIACWTSYADLSSGSLPAGQAEQTSVTSREQAAIPFRRVTIAPGDTLLSVAERINRSEPDIDRLMKDFAALNPSVDPNRLQIGETYAFPDYNKNP